MKATRLLRRGMIALGATALAATIRPLAVEAADGWYVKSFAEVAAPAPTNGPGEIAELKKIAATRKPEDVARFQWWSVGGPAFRWNEIILDEMLDGFVTLPLAARHLALFHTAIDDAMAAAREQRKPGVRSRPAILDAALKAAANGTLAPSEHAAAAAAAAEILGYLFPARAAALSAKAEDAIRLRLLAGVEFPAEIAAGRAIGAKVAALAIARGKADGSDAKWTGSVPQGPGMWTGTTPGAPAAGSWKTWVLAHPSEVRPAAPPTLDSERFRKDLAEVKAYQRTPKSNHRATYWEVFGGARAHTLWNEIARTKILENGSSPEAASRALAALNVALADAGIACWEAKYVYWYPRPGMVDAELKTVVPAPSHPSYPSAHSCFSTASSNVLARIFPRDSERLLTIGKEASEARIWAGIHYRFDTEAGEEIGRKVAEKTLARSFAGKMN